MSRRRAAAPFTPAHFSRSRRRALRRMEALRHACALGGVSLALLAGGAASAQAQDATRKPRIRSESVAIPPWTPGAEQGLIAAFSPPVINPFGLAVVAGPGVSTSYIIPAGGDFDYDGDTDVLTGGSGGEFLYFQNTAGAGNTPIYAPQELLPFGLTDIEGFSAPCIVDLDGDGDLDVVAGGGAGTIAIFTNTAGPFATPAFGAATSTADLGSYSSPAAGDIDGDGDIDILSGLDTGAFSYLQNLAGRGVTPIFAAAVPNPFGLMDIGSFSQPTFADLDHDGDLDVLAVDGETGDFEYILNTAGPAATPAFTSPALNPFGLADLGAFGAGPAATDLDGDGDLDVMASAGQATTALQYFENTEAPANFTQTLTGAEGWRQLASPVGAALRSELFGPIWTQGILGGDTAAGTTNVVIYTEPDVGGLGVGYNIPLGGLTGAAGTGVGYFVYVFSDDNMDGTPEGFPKTLSVAGAEPASPVTLFPTFTNTADPDAVDGWNMLGNPFARWVDWDAGARLNMDLTVYVWDPATSAYKTWNGTAGDLPGGIIGPFQGFWVHTYDIPPVSGSIIHTLRLRAEVPASGGPFYGSHANPVAIVSLSLRRADGSPMRSNAFVTFGEIGAEAGRDVSDGYLLTPMAQDFVLLGSQVTEEGIARGLAIDSRPAPDAAVEVPLLVSARAAGAPAGGAMVLSWPTLTDVPAGWALTLRDDATGVEVDLRTATEYGFTLEAAAGPPAPSLLEGPLLADVAATSTRFTIVVNPNGTTGTEAPGAPVDFALLPAFPNPAADAVTLPLALPSAATVDAGVYDALGRRVATLAQSAMAAGAHALTLDASHLAPGVYVVRAVVTPSAGAVRVLTQRLTVTR